MLTFFLTQYLSLHPIILEEISFDLEFIGSICATLA